MRLITISNEQNSYFESEIPMELYDFQVRVARHLRRGQSVILQAPTGTGKFMAAIWPFLEAWDRNQPDSFPRKCIYSVPMRVLANQFEDETQRIISEEMRLTRQPVIRIQTGERSEDPRFLGNLIFATIDQSLSSALAVPYSLTPGLANVNAGAFYSSYLVFDEFHLFPSGEDGEASGALVTTLQLLAELRGIVPFVLMTATFSSTMLNELAQRLGVEVVTVSADEYAAIASGNGQTPRRRFYHTQGQSISADAVLTAHTEPGVTRSLVVCNQVARAQNLYEALRNHPGLDATEIQLLHSRFLPEDRQLKEEEVRREFGKERGKRQIDSLILVATQVVEVGLDITCDRLHTEIAPANSVLQRAGRCARYPGETGQVYIYPVPTRVGKSGEGRPDYMPYPAQLCQTSWESFTQRNGQEVNFQTEQVIVDEVHTEADRELLGAMDRQREGIWRQIYEALESHDRAQRQALIRHIDSITLLAADSPEAVGNPYSASGFSFHRGSVFGLFATLHRLREEWIGAEFEEPPWLMAFPTFIEGDAETPGAQPTVQWQQIENPDLLRAASVVVVNSRFCRYDAELGFQVVGAQDGTGWSSTPGVWPQGNSRRAFTYELESYGEHIGQMLTLYRRDFDDDYAYVERRLIEQGVIAADGLDRAVRLAIACHDTAKMDSDWQKWVRVYQKGIGKPIIDPVYMAVHTEFDPQNPVHTIAQKAADRQIKRPAHAGESAVAVAPIVAELLGNEPLARGVLTAIARHHSPRTESFKPFALDRAAARTLVQAIMDGKLLSPKRRVAETDRMGGNLDKLIIVPGDFQQIMYYLWVVRLLRLCDGMSQED
jgi:CRISPR-associated endonuclease/helicase Cas3